MSKRRRRQNAGYVPTKPPSASSLANLRKGGGRKKGVPNVVTREIKALSRERLEAPDYQASLAKRLKAGKAPHMEVLLHHYGYGKPVERHEIGKVGDFTESTDAELRDRLGALLKKLAGGDE